MATHRPKLVEWRDVRDERKPFYVGTVFPLLYRDGPVEIHILGGSLYGSTMVGQRKGPTFGVPGERLNFVRLRPYSGVCTRVLSRLVIRSYLKDELLKRMNVDLAPAVCVGEISVDPLDVGKMEELMDRIPPASLPDVEPLELCDLFGRRLCDEDWLEVIPRYADECGGRSDDVLIDVREHILARGNPDRLPLPTLDPSPFSLSMLREYGLLAGPGSYMSFDAYEFLDPLLPPAFWWKALWDVGPD